MRAVKAKALRNLAKNIGLEETNYTQVEHKPKLIPSGKLNPDGTHKMVVYTPVTVKMVHCNRLVYQHLKKSA